jgi:uncharacterized protein (TIRG00374 family)
MITKRNRTLWLRVTISLVLITWFVKAFDWRQITGILHNAQVQWLVIAITWIIAAVLVSTFKWQIILRAQGFDLSFNKLWQIYWMGLFFNNFLPSSIGGDALRIFWVGRDTQDSSGAATSVVIERILATTALALVGLVGCLLVVNPWHEVIVMFLLLIIITIFLLILIIFGKLPDFILKRKNRVTQFLIGLINHGQNVRKRPLAILWVLLWSVVFQVCVVGTNYAIFRGLNLETVGWSELLYVIPVTSVAAMLPLGINGYGVREGAYVLLLRPYNVPEVGAFTASLLFALLVSVCSLWGGWFWMRKDYCKG